MMMRLKQRKLEFESRIKFNHNKCNVHVIDSLNSLNLYNVHYQGSCTCTLGVLISIEL